MKKVNRENIMNTTTPDSRSEKEGLGEEPRELSSEELVELSTEELERIAGGAGFTIFKKKEKEEIGFTIFKKKEKVK